MCLLLARDAQMKNTCSAEGLGRDLLSPHVALHFLSVSPKLQALMGPDRLSDAQFTCRPHLDFPLKHRRLCSPSKRGGGDSTSLVDSTKDGDGVAPQTRSKDISFHPSSDWKDWQKEEIFDSLFKVHIRGALILCLQDHLGIRALGHN